MPKEKPKVAIFEGTPTYENEGNDFYHEWATINNKIELLDMLNETLLGDVRIDDWKDFRVKITVEVSKT